MYLAPNPENLEFWIIIELFLSYGQFHFYILRLSSVQSFDISTFRLRSMQRFAQCNASLTSTSSVTGCTAFYTSLRWLLSLPKCSLSASLFKIYYLKIQGLGLKKSNQSFFKFYNGKCRCYRHISQKSDTDVWTIVYIQLV